MMKKLFNTISAVMLSAVVLCGCHSSKNVTTISNYGVSVTKVVMSRPDTLNIAQMDSVITVDKLPVLDKWASSAFKDDETNQGYIYRTLYDKYSKIVYTVKVYSTGVYIISKKSVETR